MSQTKMYTFRLKNMYKFVFAWKDHINEVLVSLHEHNIVNKIDWWASLAVGMYYKVNQEVLLFHFGEDSGIKKFQ